MSKVETSLVEDAMFDEETAALLKVPSELIIDQWGTYVGKHSERLKLTRKGQLVQEVPLTTLKQILITSGGVSLSSDAVEECAKRGIAIHFLDFAGRAYASLYSGQLVGTVKTRREQLLAYTDQRGMLLGRGMAAGKVYNQVNLLRYMNKNQAATAPELFLEVRQSVADLEAMAVALSQLDGPDISSIRGQLLAKEGQAAQLYWETLGLLLKADHDWPGRRGQGATDLVNSLLNYGYGVLYTRVEQALILAGLDPYAGFVHTDRPGKPSLVYDLVEEFRQPVVDRVVVALLNLKTEMEIDGDGRLTADTRKKFIAKITQRLTEGRERYEGKRATLQAILFSQARHIATFVRGDLDGNYKPFICGW